MEADWEFEVAGDTPVDEAEARETPVIGTPIIDAFWPGFVDLRRNPERVWQLPEAEDLPALAEALAVLNAPASPVWTSKCDVWHIADLAEFDPDELDAQLGCSAHVMGCYIDLLPKGDGQWDLPDEAAAACKRVCNLLRAILLRCSRVDLVIRRAFLAPDVMGLGITAYLTTCGRSPAEAAQTLQDALAAFARVLAGDSTLQ
jgi:hypothetical protein